MAQTASVPVSAAAIALGLEDARERACFIRSVVAAQAADPNPYVLALKYCGCILCVGVSCALSLAGTLSAVCIVLRSPGRLSGAMLTRVVTVLLFTRLLGMQACRPRTGV